MAVFKYVAKNVEGKQVSASISASNQNEAMESIRKQGLTIVSIASAEDKGKKKGGLFGGEPKAHVNGEDLAVFTRQLSTMIGAGIPLLEALEILAEQAEDPGFKLALTRIVESVRSGSDFSESLNKYPKVFTRIYVSMIKAGEAGGQLDQILIRLAEYGEATEQLKREIKSAMTYPVISLCLITTITIGLMVGIVPRFKEIFDGMGVGDALPTPTKILLAISLFMKGYILVELGIIVAIVVAFKVWKSTKIGAKQWDWMLLHVPVFGPLFRKVAISRFARTFSTLIQSGVPILGALEIVAATSGNIIIETAILAARENVRKGETLGEPLARSGVFPIMVTRMICIGEKSGALEALLEKISEFYEQQVQSAVEGLTSLIEPLMIGMMGLMVGGIVLAIFLPIFKLQELMRKK